LKDWQNGAENLHGKFALRSAIPDELMIAAVIGERSYNVAISLSTLCRLQAERNPGHICFYA